MQDTTIQGIGTARFQLKSRAGNVMAMEMHDCLCAPELSMVLLCPQQVINESSGKDGSFAESKMGTSFHVGEVILDMTGDALSNLPVMRGVSSPERCQRCLAKQAKQQSGISCINGRCHDQHDSNNSQQGRQFLHCFRRVSLPILFRLQTTLWLLCWSLVLEGSCEDNLKPAQQELSKWHCSLNHCCGMTTIQQWACEGLLPSSMAECDTPKCASCCELGAAGHRFHAMHTGQ